VYRIPHTHIRRALERNGKAFYGLFKIICGGWFTSMRLRIMVGKRENCRDLDAAAPLENNQNIDVSGVGKEALLSWQ
jgi:hypothetical protein